MRYAFYCLPFWRRQVSSVSLADTGAQDLVSHKTLLAFRDLMKVWRMDNETLDAPAAVINTCKVMKKNVFQVRIKVKNRHGLQQAGKYVFSEITIQQDVGWRGELSADLAVCKLSYWLR